MPTQRERVENALRKAHAAGDTDNARKLAAAYRALPADDLAPVEEPDEGGEPSRPSGMDVFLQRSGLQGAGRIISDYFTDERREGDAPVERGRAAKLALQQAIGADDGELARDDLAQAGGFGGEGARYLPRIAPPSDAPLREELDATRADEVRRASDQYPVMYRAIQAGTAIAPESPAMLRAGGRAVGGALEAVETGAGNAARELGRRQLGFSKSTLGRVGGPEAGDEAAQAVLDEGAFGAFGLAGPAKTLQRVRGAQRPVGERIGAVRQALEDQGQGIRANDVLYAIDRELSDWVPGSVEETQLSPIIEGIRREVLDFANRSAVSTQEQIIPPTLVAKLKERLFRARESKGALAIENAPRPAQLSDDAGSIVVREENELARRALPEGEAAAFIGDKRRLGALKDAETGLSDRVLANATQNAMGVPDLIIGASTGHPVSALATAATTRVARNRLGQVGAVQLDRIAKWSARLRQRAPSEAPAIEQALAQSMGSGREPVVAAALARRHPELAQEIDEGAALASDPFGVPEDFDQGVPTGRLGSRDVTPGSEGSSPLYGEPEGVGMGDFADEFDEDALDARNAAHDARMEADLARRERERASAPPPEPPPSLEELRARIAARGPAPAQQRPLPPTASLQEIERRRRADWEATAAARDVVNEQIRAREQAARAADLREVTARQSATMRGEEPRALVIPPDEPSPEHMLDRFERLVGYAEEAARSGGSPEYLERAQQISNWLYGQQLSGEDATALLQAQRRLERIGARASTGPRSEDAVQDVVGRVMFDQGNVSEEAVESTALGSRMPRGDERLRQLQGALQAARAEGRGAIVQRLEQIIAREFPAVVRSDARAKQGVRPLDSKAVLRRYVQVQAAKRPKAAASPERAKPEVQAAAPAEKRREAFKFINEGGKIRAIEGARKRITITRDADGLPVSMELEEL